MSRIGKKTIIIPEGVEVKIDDQEITVKGPKGELFLKILDGFLIEQKENTLSVVPIKGRGKINSAIWGLTRALLQNNVEGVTQGFEKKLEIRGVGYRATLEGEKKLKLELGFSHLVELDVPDNLKVAVEKNIIIISGIDKQKVGEFAAKIRAFRKPEPYKGKGVRYLGEKVRRKEGKKAATATT